MAVCAEKPLVKYGSRGSGDCDAELLLRLMQIRFPSGVGGVLAL